SPGRARWGRPRALAMTGQYSLAPAIHGLPMQRIRRQFQELHPHTVGIDDIREHGFGAAARPDVLNFAAARLEHFGYRLDVLHVHPEVIDAGRTIRADGLNLDERILADLHIDQLHLPGLVLDAERLGKSHRFRIVLDRLLDIGHR